MNLRDLEYLVSLVEHKHFGKAARASFATQPTLSMQLKKLEAELGARLIERSNRKVLITPLGQKIAAHARTVLRGAREIASIAGSAKDPYSGEIKFGLFPTLAPYLMPRIVPGIIRKYPKLKLILVEEKTDALLEMLKEGGINAAFLALPVHENGLESRLLFEEEFLFAVAKSRAGGWSGKKKIKRSVLHGQDLLLLAEGHCLRDQALEFCSRSGAGEYPNFRASSLETLRQMVAADVGMTLIPKLAVRNDADIAYFPFEDPKPSRRIGIVWRKTSVRKELLGSLCRDLRAILPKKI